MMRTASIRLSASPQQDAALRALQHAYADACWAEGPERALAELFVQRLWHGLDRERPPVAALRLEGEGEAALRVFTALAQPGDALVLLVVFDI